MVWALGPVSELWAWAVVDGAAGELQGSRLGMRRKGRLSSTRW